MGAAVCKKCKRAYPKYLERCPDCHPKQATSSTSRSTTWTRSNALKPLGSTQSVPAQTNNVPQSTDSVAEITYSVAPGEVCPTCGHQQAKTAKQRHAEWRARKR